MRRYEYYAHVPRVLYSAYPKLYGVLKERAIYMRKHPTRAEHVLWQLLRNKRLGYAFRRQHVIYWYIVDFYCIERKLIIEVDGSIHAFLSESDAERDRILRELGCTVLRFTNDEVLYEKDTVIQTIRRFLK